MGKEAMNVNKLAFVTAISLFSCTLTMPLEASTTYIYIGKLFPNRHNVTASVTFDATVDSNFTGIVDKTHVEHWEIMSEGLSFKSDVPLNEPDATGHIPLRFQLSSGSIIRWDFAHNLGSVYDTYTLGHSFIVGNAVTED